MDGTGVSAEAPTPVDTRRQYERRRTGRTPAGTAQGHRVGDSRFPHDRFGPGNDALIGCDPDEGSKQATLIIDRRNGKTLAELPFGGADQVAYDSVSKRYFVPAGHHSADGVSQVGRKDAKFDAVLGVVDATTRRFLGSVPAGIHAHSVAVDGESHRVFVPHAGGAAAEFSSPGVSVFGTQ